jgi:hypothetical protein
LSTFLPRPLRYYINKLPFSFSLEILFEWYLWVLLFLVPLGSGRRL